MTGLVFLDTETLGLDPDRHAVWEVAWIDGDTGREHCYHVQLAADEIAAAEPIAIEISGFDKRFGDTYDVPRERIVYLLQQAFAGRKHMVGAVPSFDEERLRRMFYAQGIRTMPWHYHLIDVEALAVGFLAAQSGSFPLPWRSDDVSIAIGVQPPSEAERHTALGDARWAKRIFDRITAQSP